MHFRLFVLLLGLLLSAQAGAPEGVDFSHYDEPLYQQVANRIKAKISGRLGQGVNTRDRYFITPFAYQNRRNDPKYSHSFLSVVHVLPDNQQHHLTQGLQVRKYKNREFQAFTISWLPHDFDTNPDLCVFEGFGAVLFAKANQCPVSPGRNFTLEQTIKMGANVKNCVVMWGPYEIRQGAFDLAVKRMKLLDKGTIKYRADDRLYRKDKVAINCFHAIAGLEELYPNGGLFGTGFKMWGINGTARVLLEYKDRGGKQGLLLEPVDVKKDRYGFVYSPSRDGRGIYDPVKNASAYHR